MTKELLITLIKKDIEELKSLTGGFEQMAVIPAILLELSIKKAAELRENLSLLGDADIVSVGEEVVPLAEPKLEDTVAVAESTAVETMSQLPEVEPEKSVAADEECVEPVVALEPEHEEEPKVDESIEEQIYEESGVNVVGWMEESEELVDSDDEDADSDDEAQQAEVVVAPAVEAVVEDAVEEETEEEELEAMAESMEQESQEEAVDLPIDEQSTDYVLASDAELKEAASLAHEINGKAEEPKEAEPVMVTERPSAKAEPMVTRLSDTINKSESLAQSLSSDDDTSVNGTLQKKPIEDLKGAITIADRFRFQRELFGGDGEKMMKTIADLNDLKNMEQAETYLTKHFDWSQENGAVIDFMSLLRRRY